MNELTTGVTVTMTMLAMRKRIVIVEYLRDSRSDQVIPDRNMYILTIPDGKKVNAYVPETTAMVFIVEICFVRA